jgi:hypothetical protein
MNKFLFLLIFCFSTLAALDRFEPDSIVSQEDIQQAIRKARADSIDASKKFSELIEGLDPIEGLFTFYQNKEDGTVYIEIKPEQLGKIYLCTMTRQSGDAYMFDASSMLWNFPFFWKRINNRVQMIQKNLDFRSEDAAMQRALNKSISNSIIASSTIVGKPHPETGAFLVKAADFFLQDIANVEVASDRYKERVNYDKDNSYFSRIKSFPLNSEIDVVLHFKSNNWRNVFTLADSRSMIHKYHYSLSMLPQSDYTPRAADERIGCFTTIYQDYSDLLESEVYTRYIKRWHLKKKNPKAKLSEPVEPIVFWLENTIPVEFRKPVKEGVLLWNDAFEKIGFKNAIVVKEMPDDADWDPADARYNTICWIVQPGGGYAVGPSHANPYTGQLYDADIRISTDFVRFYSKEFEEVVDPFQSLKDIDLNEQKLMNYNRFFEGNAYETGLAAQMSFAWNSLLSRGIISGNKDDLKKFVDQGIKALVVHEVGHTLGFRHNFKASTYYTNEQLQNEEFVKEFGILGSVMDYVPVHLAPLNGNQTEYFQIKLGRWDYWVVEYAYSEFPEKKEKEELTRIAGRSSEKYLDYGTDEDAYGRGANGMDPACNTFDLSSDIIQNYSYRLELVKEMWENIDENFGKKGEKFSRFRSVFNQGWSEYFGAARNVSKYIGGIYSNRDYIDEANSRDPFVLVEAAQQRRALQFLLDNLFADSAFQFDPTLLNKLVPDKSPSFVNDIWSYDRQDYKIHDYVIRAQNVVLSHVFNPVILSRLIDNEIKFLPEEEPFTMAELMLTLNDEIWKELRSSSSIKSYRRNLQKSYVEYLGKIILQDNYPSDAVSLARFYLKNAREQIDSVELQKIDIVSQAHLDNLKDEIEQILSAQRIIKS